MNNLDIIQKLVTRVTVPLDLGGYADAYAGETLQVDVTAPGAIELTARTHRGNANYDGERAVVAVLFDLPPEAVKRFDDSFMLWLYTEGSKLYMEYHDALKKKSSDN